MPNPNTPRASKQQSQDSNSGPADSGVSGPDREVDLPLTEGRRARWRGGLAASPLEVPTGLESSPGLRMGSL